MSAPLIGAGLRVLELTAAIGPAGVAGRLLADLGARVDRIEVPLAHEVPACAGTELLRQGKAVLAFAALEQALHAADVVLVDRPELARELAAQSTPSRLLCAITPHGLQAPDPGQACSELALQALTGLCSVTGFPGDPPTAIPAPIVTHVAGITAALGVLAALRLAPAARPPLLDVAAFDAMFVNHGTRLANLLEKGSDEGRQGNRYWMAAPFTLYPARDGHLMVCVFSDRQWQDLVDLIGRPGLARDPRCVDNRARCAHHPFVDDVVATWTATRTVGEAVALLNAGGIPAGPVLRPAQVLGDRVLAERAVVANGPDGYGVQSPVRSSGLTSGGLASHGWATGAPLAGVRVLEVGVLTAAPFAGRLLADLGAEVIKIEVPGQGDPARRVGADIDAAGGIYFHTSCAGKRSLAADLRDPRQRELALELAAQADIVVENLGAGVLESWGFGAAALRQRNPRLIHCSVSGFGRRGPGATLRAYDGLIQARSGLMELVRAPGRPPTKVGISLADQVGGLFAAFAIVAALAQRAPTGRPADLDVAMHDVLTWMLADPLLATVHGRGCPPGTIVATDGGFTAQPDPCERYWPAAGSQPSAGFPCRELPDVLACEHVHRAGLVRLAATPAGPIPQVATATGLPADLARCRGLAPRLDELREEPTPAAPAGLRAPSPRHSLAPLGTDSKET
jgi:crotonobetainyl-CoA:carnitine CoA-transferase CaiB-like acyl-CoA transferase